MSARGRAKQWLRERGIELVLPRAGGTALRHARLRRFRLPPGLEPSTGADEPTTVRVGLDRMVNRVGFGFGPGAWHPFVAAGHERLAEPDVPYAQTILAAFYDRFRPGTMHELLIDDPSIPPGELATWPAVDRLIDPWSVTAGQLRAAQARHPRGTELPHSQYRGPCRPEDGARHLQRVTDLVRSIGELGYEPRAHEAGHVTGHFLVDDRDHRFVVGHGNHRVAALAILGYERIPVRLRASHPPVIAHERLGRWTTRHGGLLPEAEAEAAFAAFFRDSRARAVRLGLA